MWHTVLTFFTLQTQVGPYNRVDLSDSPIFDCGRGRFVPYRYVIGHNRYAYRASDRPDILTYRQEIGSAKIWLSLPMRGRYFQWKEIAMLSRILSGLVQEKDKFCPCAFAKELYESTYKLNQFNNPDFCAWFCRFYTQIRWSFRFIFAFLMISKIIKSHWKSAMYCYCLFPLQGNRALHSYLTKQKINVDHIS